MGAIYHYAMIGLCWMEDVLIRHLVSVCTSRYKHLTVYGKAAVLNSLYYSRIYYHLMVHCNPNLEFYQQMKQKVLEFLWDNKYAKITYDQLIADKNQGGIKLVVLAR